MQPTSQTKFSRFIPTIQTRSYRMLVLIYRFVERLLSQNMRYCHVHRRDNHVFRFFYAFKESQKNKTSYCYDFQNQRKSHSFGILLDMQIQSYVPDVLIAKTAILWCFTELHWIFTFMFSCFMMSLFNKINDLECFTFPSLVAFHPCV